MEEEHEKTIRITYRSVGSEEMEEEHERTIRTSNPCYQPVSLLPNACWLPQV